jgi:hypothetical protein
LNSLGDPLLRVWTGYSKRRCIAITCIQYGLLHLRRIDSDGDVQLGVLTHEQFKKWQGEGILSDASVKFPRILVKEIRTLTSLTTACGKKREEVNKRALMADLIWH